MMRVLPLSLSLIMAALAFPACQDTEKVEKAAVEKYFYDDNPQRPLEYIITAVRDHRPFLCYRVRGLTLWNTNRLRSRSLE